MMTSGPHRGDPLLAKKHAKIGLFLRENLMIGLFLRENSATISRCRRPGAVGDDVGDLGPHPDEPLEGEDLEDGLGSCSLSNNDDDLRTAPRRSVVGVNDDGFDVLVQALLDEVPDGN